MKTVVMFALVLSPFLTTDPLTGKWATKPSENGNVTGVVFKPDNSFEGFVNKKPFVSGTYTLTDSVFSLLDNGCEGKRGDYKIIFFSNNDSIRFVPIQDSCVGRREGMSRTILGRVK